MSGVLAKIERRVSTFASNASSSLKSIDEANDRILHGFGAFAEKALHVGAVVGGALSAAFAHVTHTGAEFEQSITNVGAVMGKTRSQIGELEKSAMSLGVTTQFSSSEVAEAMEFMARKGFDSEEILQGIPGVLNAVAASGEGMAEVATVVGSSIRGFGLEAKEAGYVANLLAFTAEKTGAKITDMGTALAIAAPTAKALGVSIDDTAAAVGLLQKTGIDSSTAGSAVATMLAKISHPSKEAADKMKSMGIAFQDSQGNMLSFRDVLGQFVKAGDKAGGNMSKMSFFAELVGLRGDKAALGLERMAKSGEFDKLLASLKNTGNYAERVAQIRMDTTTGSWKLLTSTIEVVETRLFSLYNGPLRKVIDRTNSWLGSNQDLVVAKFADALTAAQFALELFAAGAKTGFNEAKIALSPVVWLFGELGTHIAGSGTWPGKVRSIGEAFGFITVVAGGFLAFTVAVKGARVAIWSYEVAVLGAKKAVWLWNGALGAYELVANSSRAATILSTAAVWAGRTAAKAVMIAQWAYNGALTFGAAANKGFTFSQIASKIATMASTAWTWLANAAQFAYNAMLALGGTAASAYAVEMDVATASTVAMDGATAAANLSMGAFLGTIGAAALAVAALYADYKAFKALESVSGGWEGVKAGVGGVLNGEGYFKGVDDYQNEQAAKAAEGDRFAATGAAGTAPQVTNPNAGFYPPQDAQQQQSGFYGEVTVRAAPGTSAAVTKQPEGGHQLNMAPSGAF